MPFTPFHMGAGLALKAVAGRHFSVLTFGIAQVAMDIEPLVGMLRDSQNRVRSMSLIHQTLYQSESVAQVDFARFLDELVRGLTDSYRSVAGQVRIGVKASGIANFSHGGGIALGFRGSFNELKDGDLAS